MARNGSGTYTLPAGQPVVTGTSISSTVFNTLTVDLANALTTSLASDGQTVPSANLPMGNFRHTGVADATARNQYASFGQVQDGAAVWLTAVAGTNTITATAPLSMAVFVAGQRFRFLSVGANTTAVTINPNGIGAKSITKDGATALAAGDIPSGTIVDITYDGVNFQLKLGMFIATTRLAFVQLAAPTGWVIDAACNDQVLMAMAAAGDAVAGSWTISGLSNITGSTAISISQMPIHDHLEKGGQAGGGGGSNVGAVDPGANVNTSSTTATTGGGLGHTHTLTTTGDGAWRPRYRGVIVCIKL